MGACDSHLRRTWLLAALAGALNPVRARISELLELADEQLLAAVAGARRAELESLHQRFGSASAQAMRRQARECGVALCCACEDAYPARLRELAAPPAVLHLVGAAERLAALADARTVAVVGTRHADDYGLTVAQSLARQLAVSGVTVLSGLASGIDAAAHTGALMFAGGDVDGDGAVGPTSTAGMRRAVGPTWAVLAAAPQRAYPAAQRQLHMRIVERGLVLSELGPGVAVRPWMLVARNRLIAALAEATVVVQAPDRSGALITARFAGDLKRTVGAVPGAVTSTRAAGTNQLLRDGARLIRDAADLLDVLCLTEAAKRPDPRGQPSAEQSEILAAVRGGADSVDRLLASGRPPSQTMVILTALELGGWMRRGAGGRLTVLP